MKGILLGIWLANRILKRFCLFLATGQIIIVKKYFHIISLRCLINLAYFRYKTSNISHIDMFHIKIFGANMRPMDGAGVQTFLKSLVFTIMLKKYLSTIWCYLQYLLYSHAETALKSIYILTFVCMYMWLCICTHKHITVIKMLWLWSSNKMNWIS